MFSAWCVAVALAVAVAAAGISAEHLLQDNPGRQSTVTLRDTAASIVVSTGTVLAVASNNMVGAGIEDVNHELIGGLYSSLVFGDSFEEPDSSGVSGSGEQATWQPYMQNSTESCVFEVVSGDAKTGTQSQAIAGQHCGVMNRGLDSSGMYFYAGKPYVASLFVKVLHLIGSSVTVTVSLVDTFTQAVLNSTIATVLPNVWEFVSISELTPSHDTTCANTASPPRACVPTPEGLCIQCSGALAVSLSSPSARILVDQVYLSPAPAWGTFGTTPTRLDAAMALTSPTGTGQASASNAGPGLALNALRLGGSMILADGYRWKRFRGPSTERNPYNGVWYPWTSSGWSIFEYLTMCEEASVELCVVTLNSNEVAQDMSDFIEYVYGNANTTTWGAQRAADGHTAPYLPFAIELGNEQDHTSPAFIKQVQSLATAINTSLAGLRVSHRQAVAIGATPGLGWPPESVSAMAKALTGLDDSLDLFWDFHIGGDDPVTDPRQAFNFISAVAAELTKLQSGIRGVVLEENGSRHDVLRMLGRAAQSNRLHCLGDFVRVDTAANGLQILGRNDNSWDQGQLFLTQNMSYLAPHGVADLLLGEIARMGLTTVVAVGAIGVKGFPLDVVAVRDVAGAIVGLKIVNTGAVVVQADFSLLDCTSGSSRVANVSTASGVPGEQNTPDSPLRVTPVRSQVVLSGDQNTGHLVIPPFSFTTVVASCQTLSSDYTPPAGHRVAGRAVAGTTCDMMSPQANFSALGHTWEYFNGGPWSVTNNTISLSCNAVACYDQAIATDISLPVTGTVSVSVTLLFPSQSGGVDAGLLVRADRAGMGPGTDTFNAYEVSLQYGSAQGGGMVLLGAHWLPGNYAMLASHPVNVPSNAPVRLEALYSTSATFVNFTVLADGVVCLEYTDHQYYNVIKGTSLAIRAFKDDAQWSDLKYGSVDG